MWSCSDEEWQYGTVTKPVCEVISGLGRVYNRWLSASCSYGYTSLAPPDDTACGAATFNSSCIWWLRLRRQNPLIRPAVQRLLIRPALGWLHQRRHNLTIRPAVQRLLIRPAPGWLRARHLSRIVLQGK